MGVLETHQTTYLILHLFCLYSLFFQSLYLFDIYKMDLRNVVVQDAHSTHHGQEVDVRIEKGIIKSIAKSKIKTASPKIVTPGLMDLSSHFNDPGTEYKEDLNTGLKTACEGGFTDVCILPNTFPATDNRSTIEYLLNKASQQVTSVHPLGALSKKLEGDRLA